MYERLRKIKIKILQQKILLNFIISKFDKYHYWYKWAHFGISVLTPISSLIEFYTGNIGITIGLSSIVAVMVKLREVYKFNEIRDTAKTQTIKYTNLFEHIENELLKPENKRQPIDDFIYWVSREFQHIQLNDPDISYKLLSEFKDYCNKNNIKFINDVQLINELNQTKEERNSYKESCNNYDMNKDVQWTIERLEGWDTTTV